MKLPIERQVAVGCALMLLILGVVGTIAYRSTVQLTAIIESAKRAHEVSTKLALLLFLLADVDNGQQKFAVTGEPRSLEPFRDGIAGSESVLQDLRRSIDDPEQRRRLDALVPLVAEKLEYARQVVERRRSRGFEAARKLMATGRGRQIEDRIDHVVGEMTVVDAAIVRQRDDKARTTAQFTVAAVILGAGVALLLATGCLCSVQYNLLKRRQAERMLGYRARPNPILLGIQLPGMSGYAVLRALRSNPAIRSVPVIAVTSYAMAGDREQAMASGCDGNLENPINPDTFVAEIEGFVGPAVSEGAR